MNDQPSTPANHRLYAIGDIHGCANLLTRLLEKIETDAIAHPGKEKKIIFLGDYVDRGLDSRGVIERLTQPLSAGLQPVFLRGNHDDMMLSFLKKDLAIADFWLQLGGTATLASYGLRALPGSSMARYLTVAKEFAEKIPASHETFLKNTQFSATFGDYYFVHAGIDPTRPLDQQDPRAQMWVRGEFTSSTQDFGKIVVHGHTMKNEPEVRPNRIGIDTGAFHTGHLTCLILDHTQRHFIGT